MENQHYIEASVKAIYFRNFDHICPRRNGLDLIVSCFYNFSFGISDNDASLLFKKQPDSIRYSESVFYLSRRVHDVQRNVISFQFKIMSVD